MGLARWLAAPDGRYWIDLAIGPHEYLVMVDTGLTDSLNWVGLEVELPIYHQLKGAGEFRHFDRRQSRDRVGIAFFHRLTGCRVLWDLDQRTWCIEYP